MSKWGQFTAVDVATGQTRWALRQRAGIGGSVLTTGGGLVFVSDDARRFRAFDADTGEILWEQILNSGAGGFPVSYSVGRRSVYRHRGRRGGELPEHHEGDPAAGWGQHTLRVSPAINRGPAAIKRVWAALNPAQRSVPRASSTSPSRFAMKTAKKTVTKMVTKTVTTTVTTTVKKRTLPDDRSHQTLPGA